MTGPADERAPEQAHADTGPIRQAPETRQAEQSGGDRPLEVCRSAAGFYLGTKTATGEPNSRDSAEYWRHRRDAEDALAGRYPWTGRTRR